jgi:hypothetical protein
MRLPLIAPAELTSEQKALITTCAEAFPVILMPLRPCGMMAP